MHRREFLIVQLPHQGARLTRQGGETVQHTRPGSCGGGGRGYDKWSKDIHLYLHTIPVWGGGGGGGGGYDKERINNVLL